MMISDDIAYNIVMDWKKKDIHPHDRALFLKELQESKGISQRQLAKELGLSHSTLQDWTCISRISKEQYDKLIEDDTINKTDIYRTLRRDREQEVSENYTDLDIILSRTLYIINKTYTVSEITKQRAKKVIEMLNRLIEH